MMIKTLLFTFVTTLTLNPQASQAYDDSDMMFKAVYVCAQPTTHEALLKNCAQMYVNLATGKPTHALAEEIVRIANSINRKDHDHAKNN